MPKRLKFVVEECCSRYDDKRGRHGDSKFSNRPVTFESNWDVRFEFESNLEASQVPIQQLSDNIHTSDTSYTTHRCNVAKCNTTASIQLLLNLKHTQTQLCLHI